MEKDEICHPDDTVSNFFFLIYNVVNQCINVAICPVHTMVAKREIYFFLRFERMKKILNIKHLSAKLSHSANKTI